MSKEKDVMMDIEKLFSMYCKININRFKRLWGWHFSPNVKFFVNDAFANIFSDDVLGNY